MMDAMKKFKALQGQTIFLRPTGNQTYRFKKEDYPIEMLVKKAARVYVTLEHRGFELTGFSPNPLGGLNDEHNGGFEVFESRQAYDDDVECRRIAEAISASFRYPREWMKCDLEALRKVAEATGLGDFSNGR